MISFVNDKLLPRWFHRLRVFPAFHVHDVEIVKMWWYSYVVDMQAKLSSDTV